MIIFLMLPFKMLKIILSFVFFVNISEGNFINYIFLGISDVSIKNSRTNSDNRINFLETYYQAKRYQIFTNLEKHPI